MEPFDDKELSRLLRTWEAPSAPTSLAKRVLPERDAWWRWLWTGSIRVPVPVGLAAAVLALLWIYYSGAVVPPAPQPAATVTLADFQPVKQLDPIVIGVQK